jgi:DNA polymerase III gamma/tau subunit
MKGNSEPLILRHRPTAFAEVWGNAGAVQALARRIGEPGRPHTYLLTGPTGIGKTTLARIIGEQLDADIIEVDAASNNGVDAMRALTELGELMPMVRANRVMILDECHMLSRAAANAALKTLEEPPEHLYFALCTTEFGRVLDTVKSRAYHVRLDRLPDSLIEEFILDVLVKEDWGEVVHPEVFRLVVQEAEGSPRRALTLLQSVFDAPNGEEAARIIALQGSAEPLRQVLGILMSGQGGWEHVRPLLAQLSDDDFNETAMIGACRYVIGGLNREHNAGRARRLWTVLAHLTYPSHGYDAKSLFYSAVGRVLWGEV